MNGPGAGLRPSLWICVGLVALVLALYGRVLAYGFVGLDDEPYVTANPQVQAGITWDGTRWAFVDSFGYEGNWHPLTWLSHMLDVEIFGLRPAGHHLSSVLLHAANAVLLFLALRRMTGALAPPAIVAALFAVHPLRVESVAWVAERKDVLSGLFWLAALLAWAAYAQTPTRWRYGAVFALVALGLMAKPMLVTLPFVLVLLDVWPLRRLRIEGITASALGRNLLEKLPLLALVGVSSVVTIAAQARGGAASSLASLPVLSRLANALSSYGIYLARTVWPSGLAVFYPHPGFLPSGGARLAAGAVGGAAALVTGTVVAAVAARRKPYLAVGWLWYVGTLVPVIGIVQVGMQAWADRYAYLPLVGIYIATVWAAADLVAARPRLRSWFVSGAISVIAALGATAWVQAGAWRDAESLYTHSLRVTQDNALLHNNLGVVYLDRAELERAGAEFRRAIEIRPSFAAAHVNLGIVLKRRNELGPAKEHLETALRLVPEYHDAKSSLADLLDTEGILLAREGRLPEAEARLVEATRLAPWLPEPHNNLGTLRLRQGRVPEAEAEYREALRLAPESFEASYNLGVAIRKQGRLAEAATQFQIALRIREDPRARRDLAAALAEAGRAKDGEATKR